MQGLAASIGSTIRLGAALMEDGLLLQAGGGGPDWPEPELRPVHHGDPEWRADNVR